MRLPPALLVCAAGLVTFGLIQAQTPIARAESTDRVPPLRAVVQNLHTKQTTGGTELTGTIINTGRLTLTYTSVTAVFTDAAGVEVGRGDGYLTAGPVAPGQSAGVRAALPGMPTFAKVSLHLREGGQIVTVQPSASRRTMVR